MAQDLYMGDRLPALNDEVQEVSDYASLLDECTLLALMEDADFVRSCSLVRTRRGADRNLHS